MDDADFQAKLERALTWAGIWAPAKCQGFENAWPNKGECAWHPTNLVGHNIPCPPLTDELAFRLLRVLETRDFSYERRGGYFWIFKLEGPYKSQVEKQHGDPACAIVLAVAALAEQKQVKQR